METKPNIRIDPFCAAFLNQLDRRILALVLQDGYAGKFPIPGQLLHPDIANAILKIEKFKANPSVTDTAPVEWALYAHLVYGQDDYLECDLFRSTRFSPSVAMGLKGRPADTVFDLEPYRGRKIYGVVPGGRGYSFSIRKAHRYDVPLTDVGIDLPDDELLARLPPAKPLKIRGGKNTLDYELYMGLPEATRRIVDVLMGGNKQMNNADIQSGEDTLRIFRSPVSGWKVQGIIDSRYV